MAGARSDVQAAYPTRPMSEKAGWGYMLLTNMLPGGGNGTFTLHVRWLMRWKAKGGGDGNARWKAEGGRGKAAALRGIAGGLSSG